MTGVSPRPMALLWPLAPFAVSEWLDDELDGREYMRLGPCWALFGIPPDAHGSGGISGSRR